MLNNANLRTAICAEQNYQTVHVLRTSPCNSRELGKVVDTHIYKLVQMDNSIRIAAAIKFYGRASGDLLRTRRWSLVNSKSPEAVQPFSTRMTNQDRGNGSNFLVETCFSSRWPGGSTQFSVYWTCIPPSVNYRLKLILCCIFCSLLLINFVTFRYHRSKITLIIKNFNILVLRNSF